MIVFSLALLLFCVNLDRPPHPDELHHVLAAQQLLETGVPRIAEGEYWRGILHTWLVAISYEVFGDGIDSARIPAVLLIAFVASILFLWVYREAGAVAAWITAVLFVFSPFTAEIAQFSRFYALQIFFLVVGSMSFFYAVSPDRTITNRIVLIASAFAFFALATWQQVTTIFAIVGVAAWTFGLLICRACSSSAINDSVRKVLVAGLTAAALLCIVAITLSDAGEWAIAKYRFTPLFGAERQDEFWFYYIRFFLFYPTLWTLVGILALLAIVQNPRLGWFAVCVFVFSFLLASFGGSKATRYLSFAPPFLAVIWGLGLAKVFNPISRFVETMRSQLVETLALPPRLGAMMGTWLVIFSASVVFLANPFWLRTISMIGNVTLPFETPATDWPSARVQLAPWVDSADIMVTTEELGAMYFLGRSDVRFSPSKFRELAPSQRKEFGIDFRTGRPIIAKPESLEQIIKCFPTGFVVGPIGHWGNPILISEALQAILLEHANPIEVPEESYLYAWGWERESGDTEPQYCSDLKRFSGREKR